MTELNNMFAKIDDRRRVSSTYLKNAIFRCLMSAHH